SGPPTTPGVPGGATTVCASQSGVVYSISAVTGAISYTWNAPRGAIITSGQGTIAATITFASSGGTVSVTANNNCGASSANSLSVNMPLPVAPTAGTHTPSTTQIVWRWNTASGAAGYKWSTVNDYTTGTDVG